MLLQRTLEITSKIHQTFCPKAFRNHPQSTQREPKSAQKRPKNTPKRPRAHKSAPGIPQSAPKAPQESLGVPKSIPRSSQEYPKSSQIEPMGSQGPNTALNDPSKMAHAIRTLYTAFREGQGQSVHYIQCFVTTSRNTVYSVRILPHPHVML